MHLQCIGHESIQEEKSGITFECLKLTAFETKTKELESTKEELKNAEMVIANLKQQMN